VLSCSLGYLEHTSRSETTGKLSMPSSDDMDRVDLCNIRLLLWTDYFDCLQRSITFSNCENFQPPIGVETVYSALILQTVPNVEFQYRYCGSRLQHADEIKLTPWPESVSKLYRLNDRRLSVKLVSTFAGRVCHVVRVTDPYSCILVLQC
jgi:hypothetical protein